MRHSATVIVPTVTPPLAARLLGSLAGAGGAFETILVDNGTGAAELELAASRLDGCELLRLESNLGYSRAVNQREGWRGYLWQGRFASFPMAEAHLHCCLRYVELNPVRAGLVERPEELRPALERAFSSGKPALVNVLTDPTVVYPRKANLA